MSKPREWFRVENQASDPTVADIHIIDYIGSWDDDWIARVWGVEMGVTARSFVEQLAALSADVKTINVHLNSPGGDVQAGINIANALRDQQVTKGRTVNTYIDGLAASIASVIAMAGTSVHMADNALMMVHNPYALAIGNAGEMRKTADVLDTMRGQIINTYKWHSSLESEALAALMDAETWMDADQAIANGLATHKVEGLQAAASIDTRAMAKFTVSEKFRDKVKAFIKAEQPEPAAPAAAAALEVMAACREAGCLDLAEDFIKQGLTLEQVITQAAAAKTARSAAAQREKDITALCTSQKYPELAAGYIKGGQSLADVKAALAVITARAGNPDINSSLAVDHGAAKSALDMAAIYDARNGK